VTAQMTCVYVFGVCCTGIGCRGAVVALLQADDLSEAVVTFFGSGSDLADVLKLEAGDCVPSTSRTLRARLGSMVACESSSDHLTLHHSTIIPTLEHLIICRAAERASARAIRG